jgi:hypothetical protein
MKSVREMIEWSYDAKAEQNWPMLNRKDTYMLEQNPDRVWAEIRMMYLLTNFKVCELEGSTMTGTRGFTCPPTMYTIRILGNVITSVGPVVVSQRSMCSYIFFLEWHSHGLSNEWMSLSVLIGTSFQKPDV